MSHIHRAPSGGSVTAFPTRAIAVTPSDSTEHASGLTVYVGGGGSVVVEPYNGGNTVTFVVGDGGVVPVVCRRVLAATTATDLVGVY